MMKKKDRIDNNDDVRRGSRGSCPRCGEEIPPSVAGAVLAKLGTAKGGRMRSQGMSHARRVEIAQAAAAARWYGEDDEVDDDE